MSHRFKFHIAVAAIAALADGAASAQSLRLVTEDSYPFQYLENKQLTGMAVEVDTEMTKRAGIKGGVRTPVVERCLRARPARS